MDSGNNTPRQPNPRARTNPILALFFVHLVPLFRKSFKSGFKEEDLYEPLDEHKSSLLGDRLEVIWSEQVMKYKKTALLRALVKLFGTDVILLGVFQLFVEMTNLIVIPYAVSGLVAYFGNGPVKVTDKEAFVYTSLVIISMTLFCVILHSCMMALTHIAMKARVACCSLIYRKSLRLSHSSLAHTTVGHIINLLSNDVSKFDNGLLLIHYIWVSPVQAVVATFLLYRVIGMAAFSGIAFLLLFVPLQIYLGKRNSYIRLKTAMRTDERVHIMGEILSGMQVIKMYTWEKPFAKVVSAARRYEIKSIRIHYYLEAIMFSLELFVARTSIFISIVVFILLDNHISASTAYTITLIYCIIRQSITKYFSFGVARIGEILITISRLQEFMILEELEPRLHKIDQNQSNLNAENDSLMDEAIKMQEIVPIRIFLKTISSKWSKESTESILNNIDLNIEHGQLVAIIGPVGSGKSSLINVILKELPVHSGYLETGGVMSYACQQAWLFSANVRQNILFGSQYEEKRYKRVLKGKRATLLVEVKKPE